MTLFLGFVLLISLAIAFFGVSEDVRVKGRIPWHVSLVFFLPRIVPFFFCAFLVAAMLVSSGAVQVDRW